MLFSSMVFLWIFLPAVIIINFTFNLIENKKTRIHVKNIFLLVASLVFYAWGGVYFLAIMICSILINFFAGLLISNIKKKNSILKKFLLFIAILLNILILGYFKYFNMIIAIIETHTGPLGFSEVALPIGISFFTFQAMSYVIDVYRGNATRQKNIFDFGLYVALFPQLIAGPIVKYSDIAAEINDRTESSDKFVKGIKRFIYGLAKKVLFANTFAIVVDRVWALDINRLGFMISILAMFCYTFQLYYDFSGYSDMAIGLGYMFGFDFKENFRYPYLSLSITEFWRRWHISLSTWFKEYVYIPLGGSKNGLFFTCINLFIVFLLTGIWHGANYTFIVWGLIFAFFEIIEKLFLLKVLNKNRFKFINFLYTFIIWNLSLIVFRAPNLSDACVFFRQLIQLESDYSIFTFMSMKLIIAFIFAIFAMGVHNILFGEAYKRVKDIGIINFFDFIIQLLLLVLSILSIVDGTYNPFIYFQF